MKKLWIIVIIVIAAGVWWMSGNSKLPSDLGTSASPSVSAGATKTPVVKNPTASPVATSGSSYSQLVQQYGSNRIQFDASCYAQPNSMALKSGSKILLDNRANQARTIGINGMTYYLQAYGYQVVTVSNMSLPKVVGISCNNQVNAGTINLQANISGE
ncbi:MAG: hypothetical protein AAB638_00905 [Patescibacteria group bacterium]